LLIPLILIAYPLLHPGIPIGNGDLPVIETSLYSSKKLWTWNEYGSYHGMEVLPRYPIILFLQLINIWPDITSKLLIIGGFAIASFSFYFSCLRFFRSKIDFLNIKFKAGVILGSVFYAYNVWSFHRISHWYIWLGYAILPLFFVSIIYAYNYPKKWKYILASVLLWSIASSTPHMTIFYGIVFAGLSIIFIIKYIRKNQKLTVQPLKPIFFIIAVYMLVNMYWIYPYALSSKSETFVWNDVVTEESTRALSSESQLLNVFRLIEGNYNLGTINVVPSDTSVLYPIWLFASFVIPILAFSSFSSLLWKKNFLKYTLFFSVISIVGLFFTIGSNAPFNFYSIFLFYTPLISNLQLIFREPDKWGFMVAFGFSFLTVIASFNILNKLENMSMNINYKRIFSVCFISFILIFITIYFLPAYKDSIQNLYRPILLPTEFMNLNNYLKSINTDKVFIIPHTVDNTTWATDKGIRNLYSVASSVPNIAVSWVYANIHKYHDYLVNSIIENKTDNIEDIIYPLGTSYLIYHNDTLMPHNNELLNKLSSSLKGVKSLKNIGFFKIFKIGDEKKIGEVNIPMHNSLIVGGLDQFASMNLLTPFNTAKSSLLFLDQQVKGGNDYSAIRDAKYVFLKPNQNDFILSFVDNKYVIEPFDATNHHDLAELWSKAGSSDPGNAWFTPYLEDLGMQNWDFDYGKGLVTTQTMGEKLSIPVKVEENLDHDIFMRYFKNQRGGILKVNLDDKLVREIDTYDKISNNFVWQKIGTANLKIGKHVLTIENVAGLNAVNIFAVVPSKETEKLEDNAYLIANKAENIFLLEAESNFYDNKGRDNGSSFHHLFHYDKDNPSFNKTLIGQFKVPTNKDLMTLQFLAKQNSNNSARNISNNSDYILINSVEIDPDHKYMFASDFEPEGNRYIYTSDFEKEKVSISPMALRHFDWINHNKDVLSISKETNKPLFGNGSLRVDIKQGNDTTNWNTISTNFIPVNEKAYYNSSLDISAKDVNQLHSKIIYFDSNKKEIKSVFVSGGRNGTFKEMLNKIDSSPIGAKYMQLQTWVRSNPNMSSSYLIDNVKIENEPLGQVSDPNLKVDVFFKGLKFPTSMEFLGPSDLLVIEKNNGTVQRIVNGQMLEKPLLDINVANQGERGMLGIAVSNDTTLSENKTYVFLYFTESANKDGTDVGEGKPPLGNRLYRYELVGDKLVNPKRLLDLPATPGPAHNGGKITIGPDGNVYVVIGDLLRHRTKAQNFKNGTDPDGTSAIYRITNDGNAVSNPIFGGNEFLTKYYAYGIRNGFGLDHDPVTGNLWDTENGPNFGDEINLVEPGFNSGWRNVQGLWEPIGSGYLRDEGLAPPVKDLVDFNGKGRYSTPELTWSDVSPSPSPGLTALKFLDSDKLGKQYENDLFVGSFHEGTIYHFDLKEKRNELILNGSLSDKVVDGRKELNNATFGSVFGGITDIKVGPDGFLYILAVNEGGANCPENSPDMDCIKYNSPILGTIYRIVPNS
jgi:glucose/arabinose dehydrogenase